MVYDLPPGLFEQAAANQPGSTRLTAIPCVAFDLVKQVGMREGPEGNGGELEQSQL